MPVHTLTHDELSRYQQDGYLVIRQLFDTQAVSALMAFARDDESLHQSAYDRQDATGRATRLALWNDPPPIPYRLFSCAERIVDRVEQLLSVEVYHWHTKMMLKEPEVGGAWEWHQDYGYWYYNACLAPQLASAMIAVDRATRENGCLQVLRGSHHLGRLDHGRTGEQSGADMERVEEALRRYELIHVELEPGDVLLFHSNLLHRSDANRSPHSRWTLISCFNARSNSPYQPTRHPGYSPLAKETDAALREWLKGCDGSQSAVQKRA